MTLYFYSFNYRAKIIESREVDAIELPGAYKPKDGGMFPFYPVKVIPKDHVNNDKLIRLVMCYVSTQSEPIAAVKKFRAYWKEQAENAKKRAETYDSYHKSCFAYCKDGTHVFVP